MWPTYIVCFWTFAKWSTMDFGMDPPCFTYWLHIWEVTLSCGAPMPCVGSRICMLLEELGLRWTVDSEVAFRAWCLQSSPSWHWISPFCMYMKTLDTVFWTVVCKLQSGLSVPLPSAITHNHCLHHHVLQNLFMVACKNLYMAGKTHFFSLLFPWTHPRVPTKLI